MLTLDIGGTSADVATILEGDILTTIERAVAGVDIRLPMLDVHTISAGGGSIAWIDDGGALRVGPRSAGAVPGPACYQLGGTRPTVTDANLVLGYLPEQGRLGGAITLSRTAAEAALQTVADQLEMSTAELASGVLRLTNYAVAQALRHVTVGRGLDPRQFALVAFGGAGGLHACATAAELGIDRVVIPPAAGVLSALRLAAADMRQDASRALVGELAALDPDEIESAFRALEHRLQDRMPGAHLQRRADLRYRRQAHELTVDADDMAGLAARFHDAHRRRHGYAIPDEPVELVAVRVTATEPIRDIPEMSAKRGRVHHVLQREAVFDGDLHRVPVFTDPAPGHEFNGPAIVEYRDATCVVAPAWRGEVHDTGALLLEHSG